MLERYKISFDCPRVKTTALKFIILFLNERYCAADVLSFIRFFKILIN